MKTIITLIFFSLSAVLYSQANQVWASRYNGPVNDLDITTSMAVDNDGNVFVTGYTSTNTSGTVFDYAIVKYNSAGVQQWALTYNGPGNADDRSYSIAVDNTGNVYVTGTSYTTAVNSDYATIKYNSAGVYQWEARYNGPGNEDDGAASITLDAAGNIYVTGYSDGGPGRDYATIKYNSSGVQLWVARYNGTISNGLDHAVMVIVDNSGNVYVTGNSPGNTSGTNYATVKYNSSGVQQWAARYNNPVTGYGSAISMAVDNSGNVYVTGISPGNGTGDDCATIKYNSSGVQQWAARYNGTANDMDAGHSIAVDGTGNVYVTGFSTSTGSSYDITTIKYGSNGTESWVSKHNGPNNGPDIAYSMVLDASGNIFILGAERNTTNDYATIKYNPEGIEQWIVRYNGTGNGDDSPKSIELDGSGNIYVTGSSLGIGSDKDFVTIKYSQSVGIQQIGIEIPKTYNLSQNYPNPFNPVTNINFSVPKSSFVNITVHDITGREIAVLVNEELSAGKYNADFDASKYSSGMYLYTIKSGSFRETKKMLMVK